MCRPKLEDLLVAVVTNEGEWALEPFFQRRYWHTKAYTMSRCEISEKHPSLIAVIFLIFA
jgi:hypothetical protein